MQDVCDFFCKMNDVEEIVSVENNIMYQKNGIDLIIKIKKNKVMSESTIEVKTITYPEEYYFIETIANLEKHTLGCILTSKAEWIVFYFKNDKKIHRIKTLDLKLWFLDHYNDFNSIKVINTDNVGNFLYETIGALVPYKRVLHDLNIQIYKVN